MSDIGSDRERLAMADGAIRSDAAALPVLVQVGTATLQSIVCAVLCSHQ
jgi:hypothetical protein